MNSDGKNHHSQTRLWQSVAVCLLVRGLEKSFEQTIDNRAD